MGCGLNSGVGSDLRGSGDRSRRVSGKLGLGFESSSTAKTNLAHDLLGEFSGCYTIDPTNIFSRLEPKFMIRNKNRVRHWSSFFYPKF